MFFQYYPNYDKSTYNKDVINNSEENIEKDNNTENINEEDSNLDIKKSNVDEIKNSVLNYIGSDLQNISVSYYNINTKEEFDINGDIQYSPASVSKLYTIITLFDYVNQGKLNINDTYKYKSEDYEDGTGILKDMDLSKSYSLLTLSDYAVIYSDNIAYHMIMRIVGYQNIKDYYSKIVNDNIQTNENGTMLISSNYACILLKKLYENIDSNYLYERMIENMKNTVFKDRLALYLPNGIVAHKIGNYNSYIHDVGIIYVDNPYILCVMTNNLNNAYIKIADISKIVYDYNVQ